MRKILLFISLLLSSTAFAEEQNSFFIRKIVPCTTRGIAYKEFIESGDYMLYASMTGLGISDGLDVMILIDTYGSVYVTEGNKEYVCVVSLGTKLVVHTSSHRPPETKKIDNP